MLWGRAAELAVLSHTVRCALFLFAGAAAAKGSSRRSPLTVREREVLRLVRRGLTSAAAAETLGVSAATVDRHIHSAMNKLGARSRVQAALLLERGDGGGEERLPAQDSEILTLVAQGYRVREIAEIVHLSPRTVDRRLAHARGVLGVETTTQALALVFRSERAPVE